MSNTFRIPHEASRGSQSTRGPFSFEIRGIVASGEPVIVEFDDEPRPGAVTRPSLVLPGGLTLPLLDADFTMVDTERDGAVLLILAYRAGVVFRPRNENPLVLAGMRHALVDTLATIVADRERARATAVKSQRRAPRSW